jgi:excisionase family DNA binding protein
MSERDREALFLRPAEAAALALLSTRAIYRAVQRGELDAVRLCSRLRIPRAAFDDWIERGRVCPPRLAPSPSPVAATRSRPAGSFRRLLAAVPERTAGR